MVLKAILHHQPIRYTLYAACVMPDHVHMLIEPAVKERGKEDEPLFWTLTEITHSLKSFTAHEINKLAGATGETVWEKETFDRLIRSEADMHEKHDYITSNPWKAGLVEVTGEMGLGIMAGGAVLGLSEKRSWACRRNDTRGY